MLKPFISILALHSAAAIAQPTTFSSGSTGADGPLTYAANLGLVYFPPSGLSPRASNTYNFTTITIGAGTKVRLSGWVFSGPVYWLAQSDVTIAGTIDLTGQAGHAPGSSAYRAPSEPGAGGYAGGVAYLGGGQKDTSGNGPGGGSAAPFTGASQPYEGAGGTFSGSSYLNPLLGGSGGGGGGSSSVLTAGGGGAGGGALLVASSTSITISSGGAINASGGSGTSLGGGGSGGGIRLISNQISNSGSIFVGGGAAAGVSNSPPYAGGNGLVRLEAFSITQGSISGPVLTSTPYNLAIPVGGPSTIKVTSVNGTSINANPFAFPDTTVATGSAVPVVISGTNIPSGTTGNLYIFSEGAADQMIPFTLTGTLGSTTATVNVPYPSGGSRGFAKATWSSQ